MIDSLILYLARFLAGIARLTTGIDAALRLPGTMRGVTPGICFVAAQELRQREEALALLDETLRRS